MLKLFEKFFKGDESDDDSAEVERPECFGQAQDRERCKVCPVGEECLFAAHAVSREQKHDELRNVRTKTRELHAVHPEESGKIVVAG